MKRMLINATQPEELRVAIVDGQKLENLDLEHNTREQKKSNIYKGKVTRIEPSLEAAFVDYGAERHGFLPFKEIAREYLSESAFKDGGNRPSVKDGLNEGDELIVQVEKEERGNKGAALTTFASLAGRFLVLMPNNARAGGVSRRIEGEDRSELREAMRDLEIPDGMGTIVRTAGVGKSTEELQWDLDYQADIWRAIKSAGDNAPAPFLVYQESNVIIRALRDNFNNDIGEILIDEESVYEDAKKFIEQCMPNSAKKLKHYNESTPLFNRFQIEAQIESAFQREVRLPSGGSIVIDHTEALVSIDINSARATKGSDIEETATNTNLEAADEVARQLRLRDLGGLVVIDFIDMIASKNQRAVENRLRDALKMDRARVQTNRISKFGLMEMSRQRLRPSLGESTQIVCPRCSGAATIRNIESLALSVLRLMEEEAMKENTGRVLAQVPVDVSTYLLNEKREKIAEIEERNNSHLLVIPSPSLETPHFHIERIRNSETDHDAYGKSSYELEFDPAVPYVPQEPVAVAAETAAVNTVLPSTPAPSETTKKPASKSVAEPGFFARLYAALLGGADDKKETDSKSSNSTNRGRRARGGGNSSRSSQRNNNRRRDRDSNRGRSENSNNRNNRGSTKSQAGESSASRKSNNNAQSDANRQEANNDTSKHAASDPNESQSQKRSKRGGSRRRRGGRNKNREDNSTETNHADNALSKSADDKANGSSGDGDSKINKDAVQTGAQKTSESTSAPSVVNGNVSPKQPSDFSSSVRSLAGAAAAAEAVSSTASETPKSDAAAPEPKEPMPQTATVNTVDKKSEPPAQTNSVATPENAPVAKAQNDSEKPSPDASLPKPEASASKAKRDDGNHARSNGDQSSDTDKRENGIRAEVNGASNGNVEKPDAKSEPSRSGGVHE
ncbi:MAG: Rne/Rng family ribonuclease [Pseudomonadota bacterium]